jgi:cell division protein FtsL
LASLVEEAAWSETLAPRRPGKPKPRAKPSQKPNAKSRPKRRARARGGIVWIAISGVLLAGVVFVNVAVLRLNLELDRAGQQRAKLRAENAALQSELSSQLASPRIAALAQRKDGLVPADPSTIGYVDLGR